MCAVTEGPPEASQQNVCEMCMPYIGTVTECLRGDLPAIHRPERLVARTLDPLKGRGNKSDKMSPLVITPPSTFQLEPIDHEPGKLCEVRLTEQSICALIKQS